MPVYGRPFSLPLETLPVILAKHADLIAQLERQIVIPDPDLRSELVHVLINHELSPVKLLARMVGPLPASEENHHHDTYGLYQHTLQVAIRALMKFNSRVAKPVIGSDKAAKRHARELVATFVYAILHDLGKILFLRIEIEGTPTPVRPWEPSRGYLLDYAASSQGTGLRCSWLWGRMRTGFKGHEPLGAWYFIYVTPPTLLKYLGAEMANNIVACFARSLGPPIAVSDYVKEADLESGLESMRQRRQSLTSLPGDAQVLPANIDPSLAPIVNLPPIGRGSRIEDFLVMFRSMIREFSANRIHADLFISQSHTIIPIGTPDRTRRVKGGGSGNVLRRVAERVRNALHMDPDADDLVKNFYLTSEGAKYLHPLADLSGGPASWCIPSQPPIEGSTVEIRHYLTVERDRAASAFHETPVIIMRNEVLWGDIDPTTLHGTFAEPILLTDPKKESASIDPETIGFRTYERPLIHAPAPAPHEEQTITASAFTYRTWLALNRLAPYDGLPLAVRAHWDSVGARLASPNSVTDDRLMLSALEIIAERLDDMIARGARIPHEPSAPSSPPTSASVAPLAPTPAPVAPPQPVPKPLAFKPSLPKSHSPTEPTPTVNSQSMPTALDIAAQFVALAQGDPIDPPTGDTHHPAAHIVIIGEVACVAWPAVPRLLYPELTEIDLARRLGEVATALNAEGDEDNWLRSMQFPGMRYPKPKDAANYLLFNRHLLNAIMTITDAVHAPVPAYYSEAVPS